MVGFVQYCWLEQVVEIDDVFVDEVVQFGGGVGVQVCVEVFVEFVVQGLEVGQVVDWCVQLDIEVFVWLVGNLEIEVWCIV